MKSTLLIGDCRVKLKEIPDESVDCVVTSPPYWGLRDYKTEPLIWDGIDGCEHEWGSEMFKISQPRPDFSHNVRLMTRGTQKSSQATEMKASYGMFCQKCGAWRGQLGLEPDPNLYIKHLTDIFDQVKRVLKPSGTCWVNLGDSYSGSGGDHREGGKNDAGFQSNKIYGVQPKHLSDVPDKCLVQIPSRFGLEMVNRGWILRNEIIWHKPNCMPSSVKDRFTIDFEKVFFFVKSKKYYFKQQLEPMKEVSLKRAEYGWECSRANNGVNGPQGIKTEKMGSRIANPSGRNKRTVWTISTKPYSGSHFAVFPIDLIAPMIDAGCPKEICPKCGHIREPMTMVVGNTVTDAMRVAGCDENGEYYGNGTKEYESNGVQNPSDVKRRILKSMSEVKRTEWTDCGCNAGWEPGTVLDPFCGSGTVLEYARKHGLNGIGIELNPNYEKLVAERALLNTLPLN